MKAAYEQNPALGDPVSIEQQLPEINSRIEKLQIQLNKYQVTYFAAHTKTRISLHFSNHAAVVFDIP